MELDKIEIVLEKYFRGETNITEEKVLKEYFFSSNVAQHLAQYKPIFGYFTLDKDQKNNKKIRLKTKRRNFTWLSIAASVVILLGIGTVGYFNYDNTNQDKTLGTYDNPELAFKETQKALSMLSTNINVGIKSVQYIQEYDNSKNLIFK